MVSDERVERAAKRLYLDSATDNLPGCVLASEIWDECMRLARLVLETP
jgi:hypothetical protein